MEGYAAENLQAVERLLSYRKGQYKKSMHKGCYFIPEAWNCSGYGNFGINRARPGEINVDPYEYILHSIGNIKSIAVGNDEAATAEALTSRVIYGMLPRAFTAWPHTLEGNICPGTFLKAICLLPYLKRMDIGIIYLLPVFRYSMKYRKGSLGSPYAIQDVYKLDPGLHDPLLGEYEEGLLHLEFRAFIEACHLLDIKVIVDFVFRTVARDSCLLLSHPDWFYWIDKSFEGSFKALGIEGKKEHILLSDEVLPDLYNSTGIKGYLSAFRLPPPRQDAPKWERIREESIAAGGNILDYIEEEFGITTAPGFSDVINDVQPPWTDVTYLKYYFDIHEKARQYVPDSQVPYILQDGAKLNLYRGSEKNSELFDYVAGVIPYYVENYGIDGARIDMGHALPPELNREIIARARAASGEFIFWSEEFNVKNSAQARLDGFQFITSAIWSLYKDMEKPDFNRRLAGLLEESVLPVTGAMETPDTPRSAFVFKEGEKLPLLVWLTCFLPNAVPFINSGQELMEIQPMNLGLDNTEEGRYVLPEDDPEYGRLAFFDNYYLHWQNSGRKWMEDLLLRAFMLRKSHARLMEKKGSFCIKQASDPALDRKRLTCLCYCDKASGHNIFLLANRDMARKKRVRLEGIVPGELAGKAGRACILYCRGVETAGMAGNGGCADSGDPGSLVMELHKRLTLGPGGVIIGTFE